MSVNPLIDERRLADSDAAASTACAQVKGLLETALRQYGRAGLIVSGGKTPLLLFRQLSETELDWSRVRIALADERWVSPSDASSNERFVREHFCIGKAATATFVAMKNAQPTAAAGAADAWSAYAALPRPFAAVLLGMGDDGHTASLFPNNPGLARALNATTEPGCVAMRAPVAPQERLSLNLAALLDTQAIIVQCAGQSKLEAYELAKQEGPAEAMPIRAVLRQAAAPVAWYWSP